MYQNVCLDNNLTCFILSLGCSHNMCSLYFALSLREKLAACPCDNWSFYVLRLCPCTTGKNGKAEYMGDQSNRR